MKYHYLGTDVCRSAVAAVMRKASGSSPLLDDLMDNLRRKATKRFLGGNGPQPDMLPELGRRLLECLNKDMSEACTKVALGCAEIAKKHSVDPRLVRELEHFSFDGFADTLRLYEPLLTKAEAFSDVWEPKYIEKWLAFAEAEARPIVRRVGFNLQDALARAVSKYDVPRAFDREMRDYLDCLA